METATAAVQNSSRGACCAMLYVKKSAKFPSPETECFPPSFGITDAAVLPHHHNRHGINYRGVSVVLCTEREQRAAGRESRERKERSDGRDERWEKRGDCRWG
jgi:hypothetical protein